MTKQRLGKYLLLSLIPLIPICFIVSLVTGLNIQQGGEPNVPALVLIMLITLYIPTALVTGLILSLWGNIATKRMFTATQRYAELHGWHPISQFQWRSRKRNQIQLNVIKSTSKNTFILTIEAEGETFTVEEFSSSTWALQFGDWIWEQLLTDDKVKVDVGVISEKKAEWVQVNALALRQPSLISK